MTRLSIMPNRDRCFSDAFHTLAAALFAIGTLTLAAHAQSPPDASAPPADEPAAAEPTPPQPAGGSDATPSGRGEPKRKEKERQQRAPGKTPGPTLGSGFGGASGGGRSLPTGGFQNRGTGGTGILGGGGMMMGTMGGGPGGFGSAGMGGRGDTASLLERALRYSPDVQLAEAKLRTAEAEVNRARLEVAKSVIGLEHSIASQQRIIELEKVRLQQARESHKRLDDLLKKGLTPSSSESAASLALKEAESELISAEAKLSELRETLRYMLGGAMPGIPPGMSSYWQDSSSRPLPGGPWPGGPSPGGSGEPSGGGGFIAPPAAESVNPPGKMPSPAGSNTRAATPRVPSWTLKPSEAADTPHNNLRRKLQSPTQVQLKDSYPKDLAKYLQELHGVAFLTDPDVDKSNPISIDIRDVPLHAALQAIEDTNPHVRFFVRDYGILIALAENEAAANKAVRVRDFVQGGQHAPIVKYEVGPGGQYIPFYAPVDIADPRATPAAKDPKPVPPAKSPGKPAAENPAKP